ncbi:acyl-CoA N-acyltransferase [Mariannaea sp. PMI_226]|nr:acyl-CoA N-acyltransferase [Mariannaea sp. PMI_226]
MALNHIEISILSPEGLDEVRRFLFWTYCIIEQWEPPLGDPAGLRVDGDRLVDDRDHLCVHIVARVKGRLVGCIRITHPHNGVFETQLYDHTNCQHSYTRYVAEIARFSVIPSARKTTVGLQLLEAMFRWTTERGQLIFFATAEKGLMKYYKDIGFAPAAGFGPFNYHKEERQATVFSPRNLGHQRHILSGLQNRLISQVFSSSPLEIIDIDIEADIGYQNG